MHTPCRLIPSFMDTNMIRSFIQYIAQKKNPSFQIKEDTGLLTLLVFLLDKLRAWLRALWMLGSNRSFFLFAGRNIQLRGRSKAYFGKGVQIGDAVNMTAYGSEGLFIGDYSWIGAYSFLKVSFSFNDPGKCIRIGKHVGLGEFAHLGGAGGLEIGDDCIIGPYLSCHPENHFFPEANTLIRLQGTERKGIRIGRNCWIGAKVTVLDGVQIGENCVIAAGAVVTRDMPANSVIAGVPARVLRSRQNETQARGWGVQTA
jgi:acetyltransferase-like isoleucine patch superfamily enzyme